MPTTDLLPLRYPPLTGVTPNVPRDLRNLAEDTQLYLRQAVAVGLQNGVIDDSAYVQERSAGGANMSVDVATNVGWGAVVAKFWVPSTTLQNVAIPSNGTGNPRVDRIVLGISGVATRIAGTPMFGATLNNQSGAGSTAGNLHLADVLIPPGATSITNSMIRDRRRWARGASVTITRNQNASGTDDTTRPAQPTSR
jgi:hypothetical protein